MPDNYKRTSTQKSWSQENMNQAIKAVVVYGIKNGLTCHKQRFVLSLEGPSDIETLSEQTLLKKETYSATKRLLHNISLPKAAFMEKARETRKVAVSQVLTGSSLSTSEKKRIIANSYEFENDDKELGD
ncbi:hypothetical protein ILUMI_03432 [Ignelater luminosus]|uniref:Uncharacterized protein n=1 Tax=Ignelater luminosus TaxID=2038154 RepID=A0A8K0DGK2_IGNLU|nr:hypothetical protein ILUMI_03432 [Ignelater luminosus]